jgi:sugar transferase (PEP-CTERM system associated)
MAGSGHTPFRRSLFLAETALLFAASTVAFAVRFQLSAWNLWEYPNLVPKILISVLVTQLCLYYNELYRFQRFAQLYDLERRTFQSIAAAVLVLSGLYYLFPSLLIGRGVFLIMMGLFLIISFVSRYLIHVLSNKGHLARRILVLGCGPAASRVLRYLSDPEGGFVNDYVGFMKEDINRMGALRKRTSEVGSYDDFCRSVRRAGINLIVVALDERRGKLPLEELAECKFQGVEILDVTTFWELERKIIPISDLRPSWLIFSNGFHHSRLSMLLKDMIEMVIALALLIVTSPLMLLIAVAIKLDSRGPVFYRQMRVGARGRVFTLLKFRSMKADAEADGVARWAGEDDPRITRVGTYLRKWRLDELPQLINVLSGAMSLVGPRPERPQFVDQLRRRIPWYSQRLTVKPGVTGMAQVNYRYSASVEDTKKKLEYDLYYVKNLSMLLDFSILVDTFKVVVLGKGAR